MTEYALKSLKAFILSQGNEADVWEMVKTISLLRGINLQLLSKELENEKYTNSEVLKRNDWDYDGYHWSKSEYSYTLYESEIYKLLCSSQIKFISEEVFKKAYN